MGKRKSKEVDVSADQVNDLIAALHKIIFESKVDIFTAATAISFFHADTLTQALSTIVNKESQFMGIQEKVRENLDEAVRKSLEDAESLEIIDPQYIVTYVENPFLN